jgi:hypothetical protein
MTSVTSPPLHHMSAKRPSVTLCVIACVASWAAWSAVVAGRAGLVGRGEPEVSECEAAIAAPVRVVSAETLADLCRERAARLPQQLNHRCRIIVHPPFVLAGDLPDVELRGKFEEIVLPACEALGATYFLKRPERPVLIVMFTTEAAYREAAEQLFFDRNVSRFGYYKPGRQAILVNLAEGDGALFHELTHVLMDTDFPNAPQWLQEGLATLHEAVEFRGPEPGTGAGALKSPAPTETAVALPQGPCLTPVLNWRGAILRLARDENCLPSVQQFTTAASFRGPSEALDYAYARYFCLFLHQRGVLSRYYAALRGRAEADPTGGRTLLEVCAVRDWVSVDREFRVWFDDLDRGPS